ncbi:HD domain-containing protein [Candidatus Woesearchaeota archaeon]|nr:HD domain-containing protein [Candidatus Woesearchaeota archaeon]
MKSQQLRLPSEEECIQILHDSGAHDLFINHSRRVQGVARAVCSIAKRRGIHVDADLVSVAALLHDVVKHSARGNHGKEGGDYLRSRGLPHIAEVVETHCPENLRTDKLVPKTVEQKIIFYADLRVNPGRIVTLDKRFAYIRECYPRAESIISEIYTFAKQVEWELLGDMHELVLLHVEQPLVSKEQAKTRPADEIKEEILDNEITEIAHSVHNQQNRRKAA